MTIVQTVQAKYNGLSQNQKTAAKVGAGVAAAAVVATAAAAVKGKKVILENPDKFSKSIKKAAEGDKKAKVKLFDAIKEGYKFAWEKFTGLFKKNEDAKKPEVSADKTTTEVSTEKVAETKAPETEAPAPAPETEAPAPAPEAPAAE